MLLAEDLLLLLTDDRTGRLATGADEADLALGGALLVELTLMDRVDVAGPGEEVRPGRLVVRDASPTADPLLDEALATVGAKQGKKPKDALGALGKRVRGRLYGRLVEGGLLRAESGKVLGLVPTHRWPAQDAAPEDALRRDLVNALRIGMTGDARVAALVSLLRALGVLHKVLREELTGLSRKELNANAKAIAEGDWASEAVRRAVQEVHAALVAVLAAGAVAAGSS